MCGAGMSPMREKAAPRRSDVLPICCTSCPLHTCVLCTFQQSAGPELAFARALIHTGVSSKIGFVPFALGGVGLFKDYCSSCDHYLIMVEHTKRAVAAFKGRAVLRGVLYAQVCLCSC